MARLIYQSNDAAKYYMIISNKIIRVIEYASRLCYDATDKMTEDSWEKYIGARVKSGHESVTEHGMISIIIDTSCSWREYRPYITGLKTVLTESNSMLHYVEENGINPSNASITDVNSNTVLSISGNLKMWRDFIKYCVREVKFVDEKFITSVLINLFRYVDINQWNGIFTADIPEIRNITDQLIKNGCGLVDEISEKQTSAGLAFRPDVVSNQSIIKKDFCDVIYCDHPEALYDEEHVTDPGVTMRLLNCDQPMYELIGADVPQYITGFIQKHIKDLSSVSYVIDMPRIITQQESRHRINSISQRSQRYVDEVEKDAKHYRPDEIEKDRYYPIDIVAHGDDDDLHYFMNMSYDQFMELSLKMYKALREDGISKENARFVLTGATYSSMVVTKPFYTLDHYFKERCNERAQREIREPAIALRKYLNNYFSVLNTTGKPLF